MDRLDLERHGEGRQRRGQRRLVDELHEQRAADGEDRQLAADALWLGGAVERGICG